jgi:hypothetical protein
MFGGSSDSSSATSQSGASINSSGWVIGSGSASGGSLSTSAGGNIPKAAYISLAVILLAWAYFKKKKAN